MSPTRFHRTAVFRLSLAYAGVFAASTAVLFAFIYWSMTTYLARQTDEIVASDLEALADRYRQGGRAELIGSLNRHLTGSDQGGRVYLLADRNYQPIAGNLTTWPEVASDTGGWLDFSLARYNEHPEEPRWFRAKRLDLPDGLHLLVGRDTHPQIELQESIVRAAASSLVLLVGLALLGGVVMSRGTLRRIEAINRAARDIMLTGNLARRIPTRDTGDDFDRLADNLNAMLDRIETLMAAVRGVSDDIAHDLRTPLARLRTSLELARTDPPAQADLDAWIDDTIASVDAILATFGALLTIAEVEAGGQRQGFKDVDLGKLIADVGEFYRPVAEEKEQRLEVETQRALVPGDPGLLFQAVANLVDNAIKYTPVGGQVTLSLGVGARGAMVVVADSGPGIPVGARDKVLRRLFRLESSRSTPGSGLGLSVVAAIAGLHGAQVGLEDNDPGLKAFSPSWRDAPAAGRASLQPPRLGGRSGRRCQRLCGLAQRNRCQPFGVSCSSG